MNVVLKIIVGICLCFFLWQSSPAMANVQILCYHEVDGKPTDVMSVSSKNLEKHIRYLKESGYRFISLDEYLAYTRDQLRLPEKSIMLTFDDGYLSFYQKVYPLLQKYQVPAMLSVVSSWSNEAKPADVGVLMDWNCLREMDKSKWVTLASHSYAMHKQQPINPQGTLGSVVQNHLYFNGRYETDEEYTQRVNNDCQKVQAIFKAKLGHPLKAMVWPYGLFSGTSIDIAIANGFEATFLLDGGDNGTGENARRYANRGLIYGNPDVAGLKTLLAKNLEAWRSVPLRIAQVDIDQLYSKDFKEMASAISALKERLYENQVKVVALQAFADPDGDGNVDGVYFYNKEVPVTADVFNYIANSLGQDKIRVVAWMPSLVVQTLVRPDGSNLMAANLPKNLGWYRRVTPFDPQVQTRLENVYRDLARYTPAIGVLFQDDLYMNDFEDYSIYGQRAYQERFHQSLRELDPQNQQQMDAWTKMKTDRLNSLVGALAAAFKENRPTGVIMRNIYTEPVLNPDAQKWFAQNFAQYVQEYDYAIVMAYPYLDKAKDRTAYLQQIVTAVKQHPGALSKVIFKLQSYDWEKEQWVEEAELNEQVQTLEEAGAINVGYYPDTSMILQPMPKKAANRP